MLKINNMFRNMRRFKQELSYEESIDILKKEPRGVLAVLGDDDYPYAVPMNHIYHNGKIYFHGAQEGHKHDAYLNHPKASYCVMDGGVKKDGEWWLTFKSVIAFGKISILHDRQEKLEIMNIIGDAFFPSHDETLKVMDRLFERCEVFELTIDHITGKLVREK